VVVSAFKLGKHRAVMVLVLCSYQSFVMIWPMILVEHELKL